MWNEISGKVMRKFSFESFKDAFAFMTLVAFEAEKMNHHPDWSNIYNIVEVSLTTHSAGGVITDKDRNLSQLIDKIYEKHFS